MKRYIIYIYISFFEKVEKTGIITTKFSLRCTPSVILGCYWNLISLLHQPVIKNQLPSTKCQPKYCCCCHILKWEETAWPHPNVSTTPLRQRGFPQCLPFSWAALRVKHCWHPIAVVGVVDTFVPQLFSTTKKSADICCLVANFYSYNKRDKSIKSKSWISPIFEIEKGL